MTAFTEKPPPNSLIAQSLAAAIKDETNSYHKLLSVIDEPTLTLRRLLVWTREPLVTMSTLWNLIKETRGS